MDQSTELHLIVMPSDWERYHPNDYLCWPEDAVDMTPGMMVDFAIQLEDSSGFIELEDGTGLIELEDGP